ncbi:tetratricopeptide repeat protein [Gallaecimonas pentaromativorans]|uniref:tetratricopeptide repeat protein n=1 Tax=Gallaecimonas pentaromativorans TaxID=584787 RepID=UPI003A8E87A2
MRTLWAFAGAVVLDAFAGWLFFGGHATLALVTHLLACLLLAGTMFYLLPVQYQKPFAPTLVFLFVLFFALPGLGTIGISAAMLYALYRPLGEGGMALTEHPIPELPFEPKALSAKPVYSLGGLRAILKNASEPNKRLAAVMATRNMPDQEAIPILRLALKDLEDDVRLLAYSLLDGKENSINKQINQLQTQLKDPTQQAQHWRFNRQLAEKFWELSYLGLAQGELRQYVLSRAAQYAQASIEQHPTTATEVFLGRVYLALGRYQEAQPLFERAADTTIARRHVMPYLAEIAFYQRRYDDCRAHLAALPPQANGSALQQLREYWHGQS